MCQKKLKCPVCESPVNAENKNEDVFCPQCDSRIDFIFKIQRIKKSHRLQTYLNVIFSILLIVCLTVIIKLKSENNRVTNSTDLLPNKASDIDSTNQSNDVSDTLIKKEVIIKYTVRKGDYPWKIAEVFFNDGNKCKQIIDDNQLKQPITLYEGQVLKIKILTE